MNIFLNYRIYVFFILIYIAKYKPKIKEAINPNIYNLRINHLKDPFGIGVEDNNFSFLSNEEGPFEAFLLVNNKIVSYKTVQLKDCHSFTFRQSLKYNTQYKFVVQNKNGKNELKFETAIKLKAPFIKPKNTELFSPIFTRNFSANKDIKRARLYITGLGLYQAYINNIKVGNAYLTPGFNDYDYYLRYQTYNVIQLIKEDNVIEVHMGDGWYKGRIGLKSPPYPNNVFGSEYKLCLNLLIEFQNGTTSNILSDETWKVKSSKQIKNSIYDGEEVDFTLPEKPLENVVISEKKYNLIPDFGAQIVEKEILRPELYISPAKEKILDFKQNMVGFVRFKGLLNKDQELIMSHGEILQNGNFYNLNLRTAKQLLRYKGDGEKRIYEPKFTYFGFRYVKIEGLENVDVNDFEGVVIYTNLENTVQCKTGNEKINKLIHNAYWGQRGNFLDVPTDCPQRDERLGWTGDTQVFLNTACYNMDSYIFYRKYLNDLRGDQTMYYDGNIPGYSPSLKFQAREGGAVWADAATIVPWNLYLNYGDKNLLKYFYPLMKDYVETLIKKDINQGNLNLILEGFTYGDWLALDGEENSRFGGTDNGFIMSVYYYHSVDLISSAAKELNFKSDFNKYTKIKNKIYEAILRKYFTPEGKLNLNTQTSYILCLQYKIYKNKDLIIADFKKRLQNDLFQIKTGFTGTPLILLTLFDNDMDDYAYRILYREGFPSWLYAINLGATTIWERWNALLENGTISGIEMNSFNHYAYGSVCESIYSRIAGLRNMAPGWKKVMIKPQLNYRMKNVDFSYDSISGKYEISWKWIENRFYMSFTIPFGTEAEVILPNGVKHNVKEGKYKYECEIYNNIYAPFSIFIPINDILENEEGKNITKTFIPLIFEQAKEKNRQILSYNIRDANILFNFSYSPDIINKCNEELNKIRP